MAKLTRSEAKAHAAACALLAEDRALTRDETEQVYRDWHEGAENNQTDAGAFFTPVDWCNDLSIEVPHTGSLVDLCAGTGRLAYFATCSDTDEAHRPRYDRIICVERNPAYVAVGKRLFPAAEWICGDALDPAIWRQIGQVDFAIANPPFGRSASSAHHAPRYHGPDFEMKILDVMAHLAPEGWAIVPAMSAPFCSRTGKSRTSDKAARFTEATGLQLHRFCSSDADYYRDQWHGVAPACEVVKFCTDPAQYGDTAKPVPPHHAWAPAKAQPLPLPAVPPALRGLSEREQRELALRLSAPMRASSGVPIARQHDASALPLFQTANEPRLL